MKDFFQMWTRHRADPEKVYPELARITDDNGDGHTEVNRPEEIEALLAATKAHLEATGFPLTNRRLVWVSDSRAYYSATDWRDLPREEWEASPYSSVYKFSHDVAPARAALGAGGCTDCHRSDSPFFQGAVLEAPFVGDQARPLWNPNHRILGVSAFWVRLGAWREAWIKPVVYGLGGAVGVLMAGLGLGWLCRIRLGCPSRLARLVALLASGGGLVGLAVLVANPDWMDFLLVRRFTLDANHAWVSLVCFGLASAVALWPLPPGGWRRQALGRLNLLLCAGLAVAAVSGAMMCAKVPALETLTRLGYTGLEVGLALALAAAATALALRLVATEEGLSTARP
jgi:hypothetical protein